MADFAYQIVFTLGDPTLQQSTGDPTDTQGQLVLAPLPEIDLPGGSRLVLGTYDLQGSPRPQDAPSEIVLSVSDLDVTVTSD